MVPRSPKTTLDHFTSSLQKTRSLMMRFISPTKARRREIREKRSFRGLKPDIRNLRNLKRILRILRKTTLAGTEVRGIRNLKRILVLRDDLKKKPTKNFCRK